MMPRPLPALDDQLPEQMSSLITRIRDGEPSALAEVYNRYSSQLMALAWRLTGSVEDAEDVLHDVFLGLPEALRHYDERGAFGPGERPVSFRSTIIRRSNRLIRRIQPLGRFRYSEPSIPSRSLCGSSSFSRPWRDTPTPTSRRFLESAVAHPRSGSIAQHACCG